MRTRITLAELPLEQQKCLATAVQCNGMTARRVEWVGLNYHDQAPIAAYNAVHVAALARRGLFRLSDSGLHAWPTDDGIALINGVTVDREVQA